MSRVTSFGVDKDRKIYGNCQVLSPEGILMFRCDKKKANWYVNRSLGEIITEEPLTIKLNFQPKGLGNHNKDFGLSEMGNICVTCGTKEYLTRHHVVPYCYRRYFPLEIKSHNFHDVLSLCVDCHENYERKADGLKKNLSETYNAPINGEVETIKKDMVKFIKIASTILSPNKNIPIERLNILKNEFKSYFGIKRLTKKKLESIVKIKSNFIKKTHGEIVIENIDDIQSFIQMWRSHFLEHNKCEHLPKNWSIKTDIRITQNGE
jgi:hypothetical protein